MKDEIKEKLENFKEYIENYMKKDKLQFINLEYYVYEWKELLDYITNLQEENERLKKENVKLYKKDTKIINKLKKEQTKKVFDTLAKLIQENETCSYRYLIYDLLGFDKSAYVDLINGMIITNTLCDLENYKQRIDKAIEYINEECSFDGDYYCDDLYCGDVKKLVDILQGSDKDDK